MMTARRHTKLVHEGEFVAELDVELTDSDRPWGPFLSVADARKLDRVRQSLREGDLAGALELGRVFRLTPVAADGSDGGRPDGSMGS
jgi:hypothetical protein